MANKDFDIKRAYEKWVEKGEPVYSDSKRESRKSAGKNSDHRAKGQEAKSGDHRPSKDRVTASISGYSRFQLYWHWCLSV